MNLWHELEPGPNPPQEIYVIVEIPKGSRNKYEYSKELGVVKLSRVLFSSLHYPGDYGFIPRTYYEDGDPLDVLVMNNEPTFPGCTIEARPLGVFMMFDQDQPDDKILAVPARDPIFKDYKSIADIPQHFLHEVGHFFEVYKDLEGIRVQPVGWEGVEAAYERINHASDLYRQHYNRGRHI